MREYVYLFKVGKINQDKKEMINGAMYCMDKFSKYFEHEDIADMDKCCHFPHYLISGNEVVCWREQGQLTTKFFEDLKNQGFTKSIVDYREVILVCEDKIVIYSKANALLIMNSAFILTTNDWH